MALSIDLSLTISSDRSTVTVSDDTVYGTGGNPARANVRVFCQIQKVNGSNEAADLTTTGDDEDPSSDSSWEAEYDVDGFYRVYFVIVEDAYAGGTTYAQYDLVYSGNSIYRSKAASNTGQSLTNTTWWEPIAAADVAELAANKDLSTESLNATTTSYVRVLSANSQYYFATYLSDQSLFIDYDEDETLKEYNVWRMWQDAIEVADSRSEVLDGEQIARRIQTRFLTEA